MKAQLQMANHPKAELDFADPAVDDLLKFSIRQQLESLAQQQLSQAERKLKLQHSFTQAMTAVLTDSVTVHEQLTALFTDMYDQAMLSMAQAALSQDLLTRQYVSATGLIMSPLNCSTTIKDIYRIRGFVRGLDKAIKAKLSNKKQVRLLYPACGPFAPLLLPLLQYYQDEGGVDSSQLKVVLVDIQPGAIQSLHQLVKDLNVSDYVEAIVEADATQYEPQGAIDILLLEALQHGFTQEGQLSIARHQVQFLSLDGFLVPQSISVQAIMVHGDTEFNQQWQSAAYTHSSNLTAREQRVELGEILHISKTALLAMQPITLSDDIEVVQAGTLVLPDGVTDMPDRILATYARIHAFGDEVIDEYDSGITHPLPDMTFYVDAKPSVPDGKYFVARGGERVGFYYQLSGLPRFIPIKA